LRFRGVHQGHQLLHFGGTHIAILG
jgi:hypothetical protein